MTKELYDIIDNLLQAQPENLLEAKDQFNVSQRCVIVLEVASLASASVGVASLTLILAVL